MTEQFTPLSAYKASVVEDVLSSTAISSDAETGKICPTSVSSISKKPKYRFRGLGVEGPVSAACSFRSKNIDSSNPEEPWVDEEWGSSDLISQRPSFSFITGDGARVTSPHPGCSAIYSFYNKGSITSRSLNDLIDLETRRIAGYHSFVKRRYERWQRSENLRLLKKRRQPGVRRNNGLGRVFKCPPYVPKYYDFIANKAIEQCFVGRRWDMISPNPVSHEKVTGRGFTPVSVSWTYRLVNSWNSTQVARCWNGHIAMAIGRDGVNLSYISTPLISPVVYRCPVLPSKTVYAFQLDPLKTGLALESLSKELNSSSMCLPVAAIEFFRDPPDLLHFAESVYLCVKSLGRLSKVGVFDFLRKYSGVNKSMSPHEYYDVGKNTMKEFSASAKALSGADLERKFSVNDTIRSMLSLFKEGVFTTAGNLQRFKRLLDERGQIKTYHRVIEETVSTKRRIITLSDLEGPSWARTVWPPMTSGHGNMTTYVAMRTAALRGEYGSRPIGTLVQIDRVVDRVSVCCAWDILDALGNRWIDDVVANGWGLRRLGVTLDPKILWDLYPITFIVDFFYRLGEAHSYFYSVDPMSPSFQYYWALASRKIQSSYRWFPTPLAENHLTDSGGLLVESSIKAESYPCAWSTVDYRRMLINPEDYTNLGRGWKLRCPGWAQAITGLELLTRFLP